MTQHYRVLANSLPRGGPFLLATALDLLGYRKFGGAANTPRALNYLEAKNALQQVASGDLSGAPIENRDIAKYVAGAPDRSIGVSLFAPLYAAPTIVQQWLTAVVAGEYIMGHMPWSAPLQSVMTALDYCQVLILRDPRVLLLALLFNDQLMPCFLAADFATLTPLQQVERMWLGGYLPQADVTLQPFAAVYRSMLAWRGTPNCLDIRFEDIVGPQASGNSTQQRQTLAQLAAFLEVPADETLLARVDQIADPSAHTFGLAQRAIWPTWVASEVVEYVEHSCVTLCHEAGYSL